MLTKPMIRCLIEVLKGEDSLSKLTKKLNKSKAWIAEIVTKLENEGFLKKTRAGLKVSYMLSDSRHAQAFRDMYFGGHYKKFETFLSNFNLKILLTIINEPKPLSYLAKYFKVPKNSLYNQIDTLTQHLIVKLEKGNLIFVEKINKKILSFLQAYRNYAPDIQGQVLWKLFDEILYETTEEIHVKGTLTGFNAYDDYGVLVRTVNYFCYLPEKKLSKEDIFIHSIYKIGFLDTRGLEIALCFYFKNKLYTRKQRLRKLALHYDLTKRLEEFFEVAKLEKERYEGELLPTLVKKELMETFRVYNVKRQ